MANVPQRNDLGARLARLERAVANLQRTSTLSSASISEGNLTIRRGGGIVILDGGSITGEGDGNLNWDGDASFGGDLEISGNTSITGTLELQEGIIGPGALSLRTEAKTYGSSGSSAGTNRTESVTVDVPDWAATVSVIAFGITSATASPIRILSHVAIAGEDGPGTEGGSDVSIAVPATHERSFTVTPGSSFTVSVFGGVQGIDSVMLFQSLSVMAVFNN